MIDRICKFLTNQIQKKMPEIDDQRAEIINYGLQVIIGEVPKTIIVFLIAYIFGVLKISIIGLLLIMPYKMFSGGVHLKTHIGCIIATTAMYVGNAFLSKNIILTSSEKYIIIALTWIFGIVMIKLYAPADTEAVPILRKKDRDLKRRLSYIIITLNLISSIFIKNTIISNLLIFGSIIQTIMITRFIYKITNNKYGYEEYIKQEKLKNVA